MMTCRCPMCGRKKAGKTGKRSYGITVPYDEHGRSEVGRDRKKERRLRRRREAADWRREA